MAIQDRDFERLMNQARIELPGASEGGLRGVLWDVINEFFADSNSWTEPIALTLNANTTVYTISPSQGGMILRLVAIIDQNFIAYPAFLSSLAPPSAVITLVWPQNINIAVTAYTVKNIILPNTREEIPDAPNWLFPVYGRAVLEGLLGRMMNQPSKSYSNDAKAVYHLKRFRDHIQVARVAAERGNLLGGQSWRFPQNFRSQSQRGGVSTPFPQPTSW